MANKCGECLLFEGPQKKCGAGRTISSATQSAPSNCFKGPASLFDKDVCGGCRLFEGPQNKCGAGRTISSATQSAPSNCYAPNPG